MHRKNLNNFYKKKQTLICILNCRGISEGTRWGGTICVQGIPRPVFIGKKAN